MAYRVRTITPPDRTEIHEFDSDTKAMLRENFGNRCAHCGRSEADLVRQQTERCDTCPVSKWDNPRKAEKRCTECEVTARQLTIHHMIPVYLARHLDIHPMIITHHFAGLPLCRSCHQKEHRHHTLTYEEAHDIFQLIEDIIYDLVQQGQIAPVTEKKLYREVAAWRALIRGQEELDVIAINYDLR